MSVLHTIGSDLGWLISRAAVLLAVVGVSKLVLDWWRGGPGRRRRWSKLFARLTPEVRAAYVISLFGEPAYQRTFEGARSATASTGEPYSFTERIWRLADDGYLQILTDDQDNVVRYSLTTCSRWFHPVIGMGSFSADHKEFKVTLGVTRFADIPWPPQRLYVGPSGATAPYEYRQSYDYARSGGYADWVCTYNASGYGEWKPIEMSINAPAWNQLAISVGDWYKQLAPEWQEQLDSGRHDTVVNTVSVETFESDQSEACSYGPYRERVHLLPQRHRWFHRGERVSAFKAPS